MKFYANTWCFKEESREAAFRNIAGLGFQGVEIIAHGPCWHADPMDTAGTRKASLQLLEELGLECIALSPSTEYLQFDGDKRRQMIEHTMAMTDLALSYGTKLVRIFAGGNVPAGHAKEECIEVVIRGLRPCVEYAEARGAVLAVESHGQFGTDLEVLVTILDEIKSPALGITLDTSNFAVNGVDPLDAIAAFGKRIYHTHLKDSLLGPASQATAAGEGSLDFDAILRALRRVGFQGPYCLEYEGRETGCIGLEKSLSHVKKVFGEIMKSAGKE